MGGEEGGADLSQHVLHFWVPSEFLALGNVLLGVHVQVSLLPVRDLLTVRTYWRAATSRND